MQKITKKAKVSKAFNKSLKHWNQKPFTYDYSWDAYDNIGEVKAANDFPSDEEIVKFRNNERQASARQKQQGVEFTARNIVKPDIKNDPQVRLKSLFDTLMSATGPDGKPIYTRESARAFASQALGGLEWDSVEEEEEEEEEVSA